MTLVPNPELGNDRTTFIVSVIAMNLSPVLASLGLLIGLFLQHAFQGYTSKIRARNALFNCRRSSDM